MTDPALVYGDAYLRGILRDVTTIAMVGASPKWVRPSNFAMKYLLGKGFTVHPINPGHAGKDIWGQMTYANLADVPGPYQMVDIFRSSDAALGVVEDALRLKDEKGIEVIWMQLGVINHDAAAMAEDAGLKVVMDRCPKIEYGRLMGELGWSGVDTGIITSRRRR